MLLVDRADLSSFQVSGDIACGEANAASDFDEWNLPLLLKAANGRGSDLQELGGLGSCKQLDLRSRLNRHSCQRTSQE
jgi:hypothetical protein